MELRPLGQSDLRVSVIGLGCNNFGRRVDFEGARKVIDAAIAAGITHFDTADIYGGDGKSEEAIGLYLGARRKQIVLATKFGKMSDAVPGTRGTRDYIVKAVEASLKRLKTDWIDLLYMHEPDPRTPVEETLKALDALTRAGKIRCAAASNFSASEIGEAAVAAKTLGIAGFVASQDEYSLLNRKIETALLPALTANGLGLVPYYPLAGGALSGKYRKGRPLPTDVRLQAESKFLAPHWDTIEALHQFAETRGHTLLELAMSWLAQKPFVASIIAGATRPEQIDANVAAVGWKLTADELAEIDRLTG